MQLEEPGPIGAGRLRPAERPLPEPGPGEVRIRVRACGICHTDLHICEGELPAPALPLVPGHQAVGVVEALGEGVDPAWEGRRVGVPWLHRSCGRCPFCASGRENLCDDPRYTGYHVPGGYAECLLAPVDFVLPLPEGFSDLQAAPLLCAGIIGYRALKLSGVKPGGWLGLAGFGASAHVTLQLAVDRGMRVAVFSRTSEHRALAQELGASWVGSLRENPPEPLDGAISFAPAGWLIPPLLERLRKGGTLALNAIHLDRVPELDYTRHLYGERRITSVTANTRRDAREFLEWAARIPVSTRVEEHPLEEAGAALERLKRGLVQGASVLRVTAGGCSGGT